MSMEATTNPGDDYKHLRSAWETALRKFRVDDSDRNEQAEQTTWDRLIDYVELQDSTYTKHDPRGLPEDMEELA